MITKFRKLTDRSVREKGSGELVVTLFTIPILCALLFSLINVSTYFQVRSLVQDAARDGARVVALYGGSTTAAYRNTTGQNVATTVKNRIYKGQKCAFSYCSTPPEVDCYVLINGQKSAVATDAGQPAVCSIKYYYSSVAPVLINLDFVTFPITIDATTVTETGYR